MPNINALTSKIYDAIRNDRRLDANEAKAIVDLANQSALTPQEKADLQRISNYYSSYFEPSAAELLKNAFSTTTPPAPGPITTTRKDLQDPAVLNEHASTASYTWTEGGQLFVDGVSPDDVLQGRIANCYMVSSFAAIANKDPNAIKNAIKDNGDGTYTVKFFERSYYGQPKPVEVTVDGQQLTGTQYGHAREKTELWVGVLEKAFAQWKGGFEAIGHGGSPGEVIGAITGRPDSYIGMGQYANAESVFNQIKTALDSGKTGCAATYGEDQKALYTGTGLYAWHSYTLMGVSEENGQKYVELRNPWGRSEPGSDGKDDGSFKLTLQDFMKFYAGVYVA